MSTQWAVRLVVVVSVLGAACSSSAGPGSSETILPEGAWSQVIPLDTPADLEDFGFSRDRPLSELFEIGLEANPTGEAGRANLGAGFDLDPEPAGERYPLVKDVDQVSFYIYNTGQRATSARVVCVRNLEFQFPCGGISSATQFAPRTVYGDAVSLDGLATGDRVDLLILVDNDATQIYPSSLGSIYFFVDGQYPQADTLLVAPEPADDWTAAVGDAWTSEDFFEGCGLVAVFDEESLLAANESGRHPDFRTARRSQLTLTVDLCDDEGYETLTGIRFLLFRNGQLMENLAPSEARAGNRTMSVSLAALAPMLSAGDDLQVAVVWDSIEGTSDVWFSHRVTLE